MSFRLDSRLPEALRANGLVVVEVAGWLGRASSFPSKPYGQTAHWDAIGPISPERWANLLKSLPKFGGAPTYNGGVYDNGTVYLWAAGKTVNVGKVDSRKLARVKAAQPIGTDRPRSGDVFGNSALLGWVLRYSGDPKRESITDEQRASLIVLCSTVCELYGIEIESTVTHRELTSRKIDIESKQLGIDLRGSVRRHLGAAAALIIEPGETMAELAAQPEWEITRRAIHRMEQMYRYAWGTAAIPDTRGYRYWCDLIEKTAPQGATAVGNVVLEAVRRGLKVKEL